MPCPTEAALVDSETEETEMPYPTEPPSVGEGTSDDELPYPTEPPSTYPFEDESKYLGDGKSLLASRAKQYGIFLMVEVG